MTENEKCLSDERYIDFLIKSVKDGMNNVPAFERVDKQRYEEQKGKLGYWDFVSHADYHYFVSRVLFLFHVTEYAKFAAYQCIENYLKAFIKFKGVQPPDIHDLFRLLEICLANTEDEQFIASERIRLAIKMYIPFYEVPRYPVGKSHPTSPYGSLIPDDIYVLDYFVLKMREILHAPDPDGWDILKRGHYRLNQTQVNFPGFYAVFLQNNANFS